MVTIIGRFFVSDFDLNAVKVVKWKFTSTPQIYQ